jgi:hypothetical protein
MLRTLTLLGALCCFYSAQAQTPSAKELKKHQEKVAESLAKNKVVVSLDTIFSSGTPYAVLHNTKKGLTNNYTLHTLTGDDLAMIPTECVDDPAKPGSQRCFWSFLFIASGKRGEVPKLIGTDVAELIVEYDLVKNNAINPAGENKFILRYPAKYTNPNNGQVNVTINTAPAVTYTTVERNRNSMMRSSGTAIIQENKTIATFSKSSHSDLGKNIVTIVYLLPDGTRAAEATGEGINPKTWKVVTMKDNTVHTVTATRAQEELDIAQFLSERFYL